MARFRVRELKAFSRALLELYSPRPGVAFPSKVFNAVAGLLSCDFFCYAEYTNGRNRYRTTSPATKEPTRFDIFDRYLHQLPSLSAIWKLRLRTPVKISDFVSLRQWRRTDLYNYLFRPKKLSYQLYFLALDESPQLGFALNRSTKDFSEDERAILNLLRPHIIRAYRASRFAEIQNEVPAKSGEGLLVATDDGHIEFLTRQVSDWLSQYFDKCSPAFLPERIREWMRSSSLPRRVFPRPLLPLCVERAQHRLVVRLDSTVKDSERHLLFREESALLSSKPLESLGLTVREAEVLFWVSQGKSNSDIAHILGMKERTACKHLERVFAKLSVENRTAAANVALEQLAFASRC